MTTPSAYFLVIHGSRNLKTQSAAAKLRQLITLRIEPEVTIIQEKYSGNSFLPLESEMISTLNSPKIPLVEVAALELAPLPLNKALIEFAQKVYSQGINQVKVLPLFLSPGTHVREDIPLEISLAKKQVGHFITIELSTFLGKYSEMIQLLEHLFLELSTKTRILVCHGSTLPGVTDYCSDLANKLNAIAAYWSIEPSLSQQVKAQIAAGHKKIAILPYFLFPGKITEAIAEEIKTLQQKYPEAELILGKPLGATVALAELIIQGI